MDAPHICVQTTVVGRYNVEENTSDAQIRPFVRRSKNAEPSATVGLVQL